MTTPSLPGKRLLQARHLAQRARRHLRLVPNFEGDDRSRRGLLMFWYDGLFANISESFVGPYITIYLLALGATEGQVGLFASLSALAGALMFLPGAELARRFSNHRHLVVYASLASRLMLPCLALVSWLVEGQTAIAAVILLATLRVAFSQLGVPAWTALTARVVPEGIRGRYFSTRTFAMSLAALIVVPIAGRLITSLGSPSGYQVSFALALVAGMISSYAYSRIPFSHSTTGQQVAGPSLRQTLRTLPQNSLFLRFCLVTVVLNFSVQLAAPFFNVYLVRNLGAQAAFIGLSTAISSGADLIGQRLWGPLADRKGLRWIMVTTIPFAAFIPFGWLFPRTPWETVPISVIGALGWAGYNLAAFNLLLKSTPAEGRPLYSALYNTAAALASMLGPLLGSLLYECWGFSATLWASFIGRTAAGILVFLLIRETGERLQARPKALQRGASG